jgi:hypothetical protein
MKIMEQVYMTTNIITTSKDEWAQSVQSRPTIDGMDHSNWPNTSTDPCYFMTAPSGLFDGKVIVSKTHKFDSVDEVNTLFANKNIALYEMWFTDSLCNNIFVRYADISTEHDTIPLTDFLADFKDATETDSSSRFTHATKEGITAQIAEFDDDDIAILIFFSPHTPVTTFRLEKSVYFKGMIYGK